ncbi:unnamed protein product [Closterium sp. NIES-53]
MTLRPSTAPQRVPLPSPPASSLPALADSKSDSLCTASPTVTRLLATIVTDPSFESTAASALVAELVDFAAHCRLDYAASLVAEPGSACVRPPSIGGECALGTDVLEDRQEDFECFAAAGPYSSQWQAAMDAEKASWKSTGTYVDEVPPPGANIVSGMWIFRVKRPPGSPPVFKARYVAQSFSHRHGVDFFHTFSPTPKMTTLRVLLHVAAQRDYELHSLDFSTAFLQGSLDKEIWLRRPPGFTGSFPAVLVYIDDLVFATTDNEALAHVKSELQKSHTFTDLGELTSYLGLRITRDRAQRTITLTQSHMVQQVLQRFGFTYSSPQSTPLPTGQSLSSPPSDESVEPSGPYPELVGCLITSGMGLVLGGRARVVLTGHAYASWVDDLATQRSSQGYTFSLGSGSVSWRSTRSSSVLSSSCEAEIYAGAMAAQELRWLSYLLTDLGEAPRSPPILYVNNKAMLALYQEHRLEHRTKHIALRYFLARELQQRSQLRLAYVASRANTADVFTKALQPCDHQPCFAFLDRSCDLLFSPTLPMGTQSLPRFSAPTTLLNDILQRNLANMAPANSTLNRDNVTTSSPGNAGETLIPAGGNDRRGKRSSEEISPEGPSAVKVLLGGTPRAASEDTRAAAVQPRVTAEERVPGRQARALQKMTTAADAAAVLTVADAGQPGPTTQKRQRAAPSAYVAQVNAPPPLTAQQLQALFSLLQQQAPGTIATSTYYNSAFVKTEKQKEAVATRTTKVARATTAVPAPALPTEPVQVPAIDDSDNSDNDDGEAPDNLARHRILAPAPPLPPLNPLPAATTFMRKGVRDQAEVFSAIQAHLRHVEFKLRNGDAEGALSNVA